MKSTNINTLVTKTIDEISIIDISGKNIRTIKLEDNSCILNLADIDKGVYFFRIISDNNVITERVVLK